MIRCIHEHFVQFPLKSSWAPIELSVTDFEDKYHQVAAACGAEFVDVNDIKIISQDNQPTDNEGKSKWKL